MNLKKISGILIVTIIERCIIFKEDKNIKHLFKATKLGWGEEKEGVWFDSAQYTKEEAEAEFKPYNGTTQRGYSYTGYEYDGQKYHDYQYLGEYEDDELPRNDKEYWESRDKIR